MVNSFLNAVTKQLGTTFGNSNRYYVEDVEQGMVEPCFTIDILLPLQRSKSAVLYERTMPLVIHWFSGSNTTNKKDCYEMAERTIECLEYLPFNNTLIRGEDISWKMVDDVLEISITYKFTTTIAKDEDKFETLDTLVGHK